MILRGKGARAQIMMCSTEAVRHQIFPGMKLSEAKAVCADLVWRDYDEVLYREAQTKLSRALIVCSPKVTALEPGLFALDADGLNFLGGEHRLCREVQKVVGRAGYTDVHIGIASSAFTAIVASKFKRNQFYIVPRDEDGKFLSPLSIKHLPISVDMHDSLHELGIRTMGQLAALGDESLQQRFGREGLVARELCRGIDKRQPQLPPLEREFKCSIDLGSPIELLHEIQFVLKSMIDRLTRDMREQGWWAEELHIAFFNDNDKFDERPISLLRPSNNAKFLLEVMKLSLEANPIKREVTAIELSISRFSKESWHQTDLHTADAASRVRSRHDADDASNPDRTNSSERANSTAAGDGATDPDAQQLNTSELDHTSLSLTLMLQRFVSRLGENAVVKSVPNDHYLPEHAGAWVPIANKPTVLPVLPVNIAYINARTGPTGLVSGLALRRCQPPQPVLVDLQTETPKALTYQSRWYTVKEITEPERLSALWWDQSERRSYYIALLEPRDPRSHNAHSHHPGSHDQLLAMLVHDHEANAWYINGFYD